MRTSTVRFQHFSLWTRQERTSCRVSVQPPTVPEAQVQVRELTPSPREHVAFKRVTIAA